MRYEQLLDDGEILLRALEPSDVEVLYRWENDTTIWGVSTTLAPFSKETLRRYIENVQDIYEAKQLRFMIADKKSGKTIGTIDLFDFDAHNRRAGVGIFLEENSRNNHAATKALAILLRYCRDLLLLHQVFAEMQEHNEISKRLFEHAGFEKIGTKKDWLLNGSGYEDVVLMQKIL